MFFLSSAAFAQNAYMGIGMGLASYSESYSELDTDGYFDYSFDDSDTGFNIYGGLKFNEYFGFELSYTDFGKQNGSMSIYDYLYDVGGIYDASLEVSGFGVSVVGFFPLSDDLNLFLKAGTFAWDVDLSVGPYSGSDDDSDLLFGFGAEYRLNDQFSLRGAWEMVDVEGADLDMLSVNAQINF
jgi:OOP family OmpA-OmpF porin